MNLEKVKKDTYTIATLIVGAGVQMEISAGFIRAIWRGLVMRALW